MPATILPSEWQIQAFIGGCIFATSVLFVTQRMLFTPTEEPTISDTSLSVVACALIMAAGVTIIAKDLGNMGLSLSGGTIKPIASAPVDVSPVVVACLSSVVYPIAYSLVLVGILARGLLKYLSQYPAILVAIFITLIGAPFHAWPRLAAVTFLPLWLFYQTRSLSLASICYLPATILPLLNALNIGPGIAGFDIEDPQRIILQPLWFNVIGLVLIVVGATVMNHIRRPDLVGHEP